MSRAGPPTSSPTASSLTLPPHPGASGLHVYNIRIYTILLSVLYYSFVKLSIQNEFLFSWQISLFAITIHSCTVKSVLCALLVLGSVCIFVLATRYIIIYVFSRSQFLHAVWVCESSEDSGREHHSTHHK